MGLSLAGFCEAYGRYNISAVVFDKKKAKLMPGGGYLFVWGLTISSKKAGPRFISILLLMTSYDLL